MTEMDIRTKYRELLRSLREGNSTQSVTNLRPWHCAAAVSELMAFACDSQKAIKASSNGHATVRILTGSCPQHVYGKDAMEPTRQFVLDGGQVRVLVYNDSIDTTQNSLYSLGRQFPQTVQWRLSRTNVDGDKLSHFFVVNAAAFRLEAPHRKLSGENFTDCEPKIPARICFNDPETANQLVKFFDGLWECCAPVQ